VNAQIASAVVVDRGAFVLAIVVGPGRLAAGIVDTASGDAVVRDRVSTPNREIWRSLEHLLRRVLAARPSDVPAPSAVAVSCVGPVDATAGSVSPELLPVWSGFPLRQRLEDLTGLPVVLDTSAGALVHGEHVYGELGETSTFFALVVDQSVESACLIDGRRIRGAHGNAGSLAHITVDPRGQLCACGASGCLSVLVSASSLEAEMNRPLRRATPSIIERTGIMLGRAIASAAAVFDVSTFVVSGSVVDTFGDPMLAVVRREVDQRSHLEHLQPLRILEVSGYVHPLTATAALSLGTGSQ
jgi:glucokinase